MKSRNFRASSFRFRFPSMAATPRSFLALILACSCLPLGVDFPAVAATPPAAKDKKQKPDPALKGLPITELSPDEAILHALNRLAYGPRPGDVERVRQMGLAKWIERQLNPNSIDDKGVEARLEDYPTLRMSTAKVTRAIYSERQLQQVVDDFWFNHFNVFAGKGEDRYYLTSYERDVIQPHALAKFKDLLTATAKSPAMLFYLDNFLSADPRAQQRIAMERAMRQQMRYGRFGRPWPPRPPVNPQQAGKKNERGLNENYGRELMELHTLGVDGGYTQKDVTEVARA